MPTSSPAPSRAVPSKLGIGCLGVLVPLMGGLLFVSLGGEGGWWVFVPPVMVGVYLFLARHERGTLRAFFNALGAVVLAPLLYILVRAALGLSIGLVPFLDDGCDPPWINEATPFLEGLFSVVYYTPIGVVGFLVARWLVWRECRPLEPLLHRASLGALILGALLFLGLLPRALTASDPRHYIANLPVLGVVPPVSGEPADVVGLRGFSARIYEAPIADIVVSRICPSDRSTCWIDARPAGAPRPKGKDLL
ncbi:MAG TPA: hypothetical protein VK459_20505, partial [Polyangiaceae bacterium]|nr:hypothetical protein [Polyangiaceae bacterium]